MNPNDPDLRDQVVPVPPVPPIAPVSGMPPPPVAPPPMIQHQQPQQPSLTPEQAQEDERRKRVLPVPVWFTANTGTMTEKDFHRDRFHIPFKKIAKVSTVLLLALGIIVGTGYGLVSINKETNRLTASAAAERAKDVADAEVNYHGDGSDILKSAPPQVTYECPVGLTKKSSNSDECFGKIRTTLSGAKYSCAAGQKMTGSGANTKCVTRENPTTKTVAAAMITACDTSGFVPSGNNCVKKETLPGQKQYLCPSGQVPAGEGDQTLCTVGPQKIIVDCPSTFSVSGTGCSKSTAATKHVAYPPCASYYYMSAPEGQCRGLADVSTQSWCGPYPGFSLITTTNPDSCLAYRDKTFLRYDCPSGYTPGATCRKTVTTTQTQAAKNGVCPSGWVATRVDQFTVCKRTITDVYTAVGKPVYAACSYIGAGWTEYNATRCQRRISPAPDHYVYSCKLAGEIPFDYGPGPGSGCLKNLTPIVTYSCNVGSLSGANCVETAKASYRCPAGSTMKGSGASAPCIVNSAPTSPPTVKIVCTTSGFSPVGVNCEKTTTTPGKRVLGCEDPTFTFNAADSKCTRIDGGKEITVAPKVNYVCDPGFAPIGSGEDLKCTKEEEKTEKVQKLLKCEEGWKKRIASDGTVDCVLVKEETTAVN